MKNKALLPIISAFITFITIALYVGVLFINGVIFTTEQQPIIVFISGITVFSIFSNMVSYWSLIEQSVLDSDEMKRAFQDYDDYVKDNILDAFDFDKVITTEYNANRKEQRKQDLYKKYLSTDLRLKIYNHRILVFMPKIKFIEMNIHYKNREKKLDKLKSKLADNNFKKSIREQRLEMKAATRSINYRRVSPQSIFTRNNNKNYYADGVNKLSQHRNIFMTTRSVFSTLTTFFPILFVFSITGEINLAYIFPIGFGLFAVIITILQTIIFAKRYTRVDTIDYLNDLFYIVKWYVSFRNLHTNKIKE